MQCMFSYICTRLNGTRNYHAPAVALSNKLTAVPDVCSPWSWVVISDTILGYLARMPIWPVPARACRRLTFFKVTLDQPHLESWSVHFWMVPLLIRANSLGWSEESQFAIDWADQPTLHAVVSMYAQRNGWYQFVRQCHTCFAPPQVPFCFGFQSDLGLESAATSSSADGCLLCKTCWILLSASKWQQAIYVPY
jgi:hypothetical protein